MGEEARGAEGFAEGANRQGGEWAKDLAEAEVVVEGEAGVFEDFGGQATTDVTGGVHGDGDADSSGFMPEREVAAGLAVFEEALRFEETHEIARGNLRHSAHAGIPTLSSSTWTLCSFWGISWP